MMKLWICVPGGDDDRERVVFETNDINEMDDAINRFWNDEVEYEDEYFMIENEQSQDCFNNPDEWFRAFRGYYESESLSRYLGRKLLPHH